MSESENLQQQLNELDMLQAIFAGDGEFELIGDGPGAGPQTHLRINLELLGTKYYVLITVPLDYPSAASPTFAVNSFPSKGHQQKVEDAVTEFVAERLGAPCIFECLQHISEMAELCFKEVAQKPSMTAASNHHCHHIGEDTAFQGILRIDHMNKPKDYVRKLSEWSLLDGLSVNLFFRCEGLGRYRDVHLVVSAPSREVWSSFLRRLRTQLVDVDSRGNKCRERKSEVLVERDISSYRIQPGLRETEFSSNADLENLLEQEHHMLSTKSSGETHGVTGISSSDPERLWAVPANGGSILHVVVRPGRQSSEVTNLQELRCASSEAAMCIDLKAPPRDGEANVELVKLLANILRLPQVSVTIRSGAKSREKQVFVTSLSTVQVVERIAASQL